MAKVMMDPVWLFFVFICFSHLAGLHKEVGGRMKMSNMAFCFFGGRTPCYIFLFFVI